MKVAVIGTGYVGLVTGVCLGAKGHDVTCVDVDAAKVAAINRGEAPIHEPGLQTLLKANLDRNLRATSNLHDAIMCSDLSLIAVGTPFAGHGTDLSFVRQAAAEIGAVLERTPRYHVVVVKSTVPPGTTDDVVLPILERASGRTAGADFGVGMSPEFLTEGTAVEDFMDPDRIVLGGLDQRTVDALAGLYRPFEDVPVIRTNNKTAEMIKYASNSLLATLISFSNEMGNLCACMGGVDIVDVMKGVHLSRYLTLASSDRTRVMAPITSFVAAGCGFGGSCLPKDVRALIAHGAKAGRQMPLLEAVTRVNEEQPDEIIRLLKKHVHPLRGARVAVLGLAFKPDTDDVRESPAIPVIDRLEEEGALVKVHDPVAKGAVGHLFRSPRVASSDQLEEAISDAQAVILITRWEHFREVPKLLADLDPQPVFIDGRRMFDPAEFARYEGIGR